MKLELELLTYRDGETFSRCIVNVIKKYGEEVPSTSGVYREQEEE